MAVLQRLSEPMVSQCHPHHHTYVMPFWKLQTEPSEKRKNPRKTNQRAERQVCILKLLFLFCYISILEYIDSQWWGKPATSKIRTLWPLSGKNRWPTTTHPVCKTTDSFLHSQQPKDSLLSPQKPCKQIKHTRKGRRENASWCWTLILQQHPDLCCLKGVVILALKRVAHCANHLWETSGNYWWNSIQAI